MSNIGGHTFSMVMQEDFFMEFFLFDGGCLWNVADPKMEVVVMDLVVWVVWANLGVLLEVVILVQLMVWGLVWEMVVRVLRKELQWMVEEVPVWVLEELVGGISAGSLRLSESFEKTSHKVFHSFSNLFSVRLSIWTAWREKGGGDDGAISSARFLSALNEEKN